MELAVVAFNFNLLKIILNMNDEDKKIEETVSDQVQAVVAKYLQPESSPASSSARRGGGAGAGARRGGGGGGNRRTPASGEMDQRILDIARVTRVMKGGKRMSFRACVAIGDKKGTIAIGLGKGADVTMAVNKAVNQAKKDLLVVNTVNDTIPHEVFKRIGASKILFKPAKRGRGVIAGGVVRVILELAGIKNITSKILGGGNKINNARCTLAALKELRKVSAKS